MTTTTLHDYLRKIENLLDENHFSEATNHCRHILQHYPRHVDTYRLFARALLEQRHYEDAGDLFRRILGTDPNDLVAHVGLADVYKQETLLEQSLWHLERAFELEPYNHVIQDELRRLASRHNEVTLERIPLNQGALARIYLREELYQQAVNELRQVLHHNGERVDLQVVLAEALWRDGQRVEAAAVCERILEQLPNCISANAILADIWLQTGRVGEAHLYLGRVQALTQMGSRQLDLETAAGHAFSLQGAPLLPDEVTIDILEVSPEAATPVTPPADWVSEVTFSDEEAEQPAPVATENGYRYDWLAGLDEAAEQLAVDSDFEDVADLFGEGEPLSTDEVAADEPEPADTGDDIPSWLKEQTDPEAFTREEIPDWLSESAAESETGTDETVAEPAEMPAGMPEWLADVSGVDEFEPMEVDPMLASEWFVESEDSEAEMPVASEASVDEVGEGEDDWLATLARDTGEFPEQVTADDETSGATELEEWLAADTAGARYGDEVTDWLLGSDLTENELEEIMADIPAGLPADDNDEKDNSLPGVTEPEDTTSDELDDAMAWLDALTDSEDESEPVIMDELAGEELPDWLADLSGPAESDDVAEVVATASGYADDDLPDWLRASSLDDDLLGTEEAEGAATDEDEPGYLDRIAAGEGAPIDELPTQVSMAAAEPEAEDDIELSDWLSDLDNESVEEMDTGGLAWLDQLSAGAPVEQMPTLEWGEEPDEAEPTLDWLSEMAAPPDETLVNLALVHEEETDQDDAAAEEDTVVDVPEDLDDAMAWLEELAAQQGAPVEELPTVANVLETDVVDAFEDEESIGAETQPTAEAEPELAAEAVAEPFADVPEDLDEAMAWLEELAARQGAPLEELPGMSSAREEAGEVEVEEEPVAEEIDVLPELDEALAEAEGDLDDAMAWLEDLMKQQDEPVEMGEEAEKLEEPEPVAMIADQGETTPEPETGDAPDAIRAHDELAEALDWLEQVALEGGPFEKGPLTEMEEVDSVKITDDELAAELDWLEQVAGGEAPPTEPADKLLDAPDDSEAALDWLEQLATEEEAEAKGDGWAEEEAEAAGTPAPVGLPEAFVDDSVEVGKEAAEPEIDFLVDMPDDPDEAMVWLERLAARQGAPLEELPSMVPGEEEEEIATPAWLEAEVTVEEVEFAGEADMMEAEPEEVLAEADEPPESIGAGEPEVGAPPAEAESEAPEPGEEAEPEEQLVANEVEWLEALPGADVSDWLAAEEEATVISSEAPTPAPATGPLFEAPPERLAEVGPAPEPDDEEDSLILADLEPATSALTLDEAHLAQARQALASGNYEEAMHSYHSLVARGEGLIALIGDLEMAVSEHPQRPLLRRVLGDAYMRNGQLQKALETYRETLDQL